MELDKSGCIMKVPGTAAPPMPAVHAPPIIARELSLLGDVANAEVGRVVTYAVPFKIVMDGTDVETDEYAVVSVGKNVAETSVYVPTLNIAKDEFIVKVPATADPPTAVKTDPPVRVTEPRVAGYVIAAAALGRDSRYGATAVDGNPSTENTYPWSYPTQ